MPLLVWLLLQLTTLLHCSASLWACADSLKARTRDYHHRKAAFPLANTTLSTQYRSPGKQEESLMVLYKMIPIQLGAGTFCTWQPVPAAVKNSWKAEAPSRAVNVIIAVSTGASLLCTNKIWTVPLPWGFMWCIAPKMWCIDQIAMVKLPTNTWNYQGTIYCFSFGDKAVSWKRVQCSLCLPNGNSPRANRAPISRPSLAQHLQQQGWVTLISCQL